MEQGRSGLIDGAKYVMLMLNQQNIHTWSQEVDDNFVDEINKNKDFHFV